MTSISSSYSSYSQMHRPDPSQMASKLFSKLDTKGQGYLEKSDLQSALSSLSSDSSSSDSDVDALFTQLDSNSDGKVTQDEMTTQLQKLADELDSQFSQMRMQSGMDGAQGMPPPPPQESQDSGFTKDELSSQLEEIGSTDSKRSSLISDIVNNFAAADTDGDGKVTNQEAMAYEQQNSDSSSSSNSSSSSSSTSASTEAKLMHQIMELMRAYGGEQSAYSSAYSSVVSTSA